MDPELSNTVKIVWIAGGLRKATSNEADRTINSFFRYESLFRRTIKSYTSFNKYAPIIKPPRIKPPCICSQTNIRNGTMKSHFVPLYLSSTNNNKTDMT
ncbi:MAG TPA: hypothetical protein ENG80_01415 [Nitrospirae bacterium]|nr:hypothetical protein [Nitrospirota bacterium]